jgi:hypothetical protein
MTAQTPFAAVTTQQRGDSLSGIVVITMMMAEVLHLKIPLVQLAAVQGRLERLWVAWSVFAVPRFATEAAVLALPNTMVVASLQ